MAMIESMKRNNKRAVLAIVPDASADIRMPASMFDMLQQMNPDAGGLVAMGIMIRDGEDYVMNAEFDAPAGWELQNMLQVGRLLGGLALLREESRGVHYRTDFPERDDAAWQCRLAIQRGSEPERRAVTPDGTPRPGT